MHVIKNERSYHQMKIPRLATFLNSQGLNLLIKKDNTAIKLMLNA